MQYVYEPYLSRYAYYPSVAASDSGIWRVYLCAKNIEDIDISTNLDGNVVTLLDKVSIKRDNDK